MEKMELFMNKALNVTNQNITGEARVLLDAFSKIEFGQMTLQTPDLLTYKYIGKKSGPVVDLCVSDWSVFSEVLNKSDIGFAETFIDQKWKSNSIERLIEFCIMNEKSLTAAFKGNWARILFYRLKHETRENSKTGSKKNILAHYDLGNSFYSLWLDKTMTYSSALFLSEQDVLEKAQDQKYQSMLNLIGAKPGDHILEVGCGWGGFIEYACKKGFRVTGITISDEQYNFAVNRIKEQKLEQLAEVRLCDYRDLEGKFDHAVSIEMIEAVGEKYWDSYFDLFKKVLKPGGKFSIQAIVIQDDKFESYRKGTDFIQQYIFPGGMLLSPNVIKKLLVKKDFKQENMLFFGLDYARTLREWKVKFNIEKENVAALSFDENFMRLWNFYLGYCEGAFLAGRIDVVQFSASV
jgi:cyclopropane-fatty-acyl-phospholipid synthase